MLFCLRYRFVDPSVKDNDPLIQKYTDFIRDYVHSEDHSQYFQKRNKIEWEWHNSFEEEYLYDHLDNERYYYCEYNRQAHEFCYFLTRKQVAKKAQKLFRKRFAKEADPYAYQQLVDIYTKIFDAYPEDKILQYYIHKYD
jgi:hypothetical protein